MTPKEQLGLAIANTVAEWAALLRFFPQDEISKTVIMRLLDRMVSTTEQVDWLRVAMVDKVGEWRGAKELRGVFCSRFPPKDGIETDCEAGPFTPAALESAAHHRELTAGEERKLLTGEVEPPVSADPELAAAVDKLVSELPPRIVPTRREREASREWCERHGLPI